MRVILVISAILACMAIYVNAQAPIPVGGLDGWGMGGTLEAPIVLDLFIDLLCPDSRQTWPVMKEVSQHYGNNLHLRVHTFPLPFHTWSFLINQGAGVVAANNISNIFTYMDLAFANQDNFGNGITSNQGSSSVIKSAGDMVEAAGIMAANQFVNGLNDPNFDWNQRVSWKFGCSKAVLGTPTYFINGVYVEALSTWSTSDWESVLDSLLPASARSKISQIHYPPTVMNPRTECPANTTECTYLPGKVACCPPSEYCILNVGCRC